MFTVCPKCTLTLALTANDLRLGQGYVRCGRCSNVFNSLLKLSDAPGEDAVGANPPELAQADPASTSQIHRAITAAAMDGTAGTTAASSAASAASRPASALPPNGVSSAQPPRPSGSVLPAAASPAVPPPASAAPGVTVAPAARSRGPDTDSDLRRTPEPSTSAPALPSVVPESDADAIDQFELVLQTLGLNPDGHESALQPPANAGQTPTVENIVLEGDGISQSEALVPDKPLDELDLFTRRLGVAAVEPTRATSSTAAEKRPRMAKRSDDAVAAGDATTAVARASGRATATAGQTIPVSTLPAESDSPESGVPDLDIPALRDSMPRHRRLWASGIVALALVLFAQLVNHWRDALAASPSFGRPVTELYSALGLPLQPHWDLSAYEVRQQGAESDGGSRDAISVRFSLANHAMRAQPVPLLRLTLLDRYGRRVAERDLSPADYWPHGRSSQNFLGADERVDTQVQVRDPSADSASFELDVCLRDNHGVVRCAGDAAAADGAASGTP